jgi:two-component system chemotaxis response regulator CheY
MSAGLKYILVDDDDLCNEVSKMIMEDALGEVDIKAFTRPIEALEFIEKEYTKNLGHTILFLDINMPRINGWQFLEQFEKFSEDIKQQINIYMLSSSIDRLEINKAEANKNVEGFISKPLDIEILTFISEKEF